MLTVKPSGAGAPPGIDPAEFAAALAEDTGDVLTSLAGVQPLFAASPDTVDQAREWAWPGTDIVTVPAQASAATVFAAVERLGYRQAALIAPDAPDLPTMHVAKLFSSLASADMAVSPCEDGGLVGLAARLPIPAWLLASEIELDTVDALERLFDLAPVPDQSVTVTPRWHRIRTRADIGRLIPDLEGWEATRALLSGQRRPQWAGVADQTAD